MSEQEVQQSQLKQTRIVGREVAVELTGDELEQVTGGRWVSDGSGIMTGWPGSACNRDDSPQVWVY